MPLLNYTTSIDATKTVAEISKILVRAKAAAILTEYSPEGFPSAVSFKILTEFGVMTFRLPSNAEQVYKVLQRHSVPRALRTLAQANRVAWRIVKDWVEAQVAMIECGLVEVAQVFLPYAQDSTGTTIYENLKMKRFSGYLLESNP